VLQLFLVDIVVFGCLLLDSLFVTIFVTPTRRRPPAAAASLHARVHAGLDAHARTHAMHAARLHARRTRVRAPDTQHARTHAQPHTHARN
jgi:hypothetical protein